MPPVAVHVTPVFEEPVTVAVNCCVAPDWTVAVVGEIEILTLGGAPAIVTAAEALLVESAALVAVTENEPAVVPAV